MHDRITPNEIHLHIYPVGESYKEDLYLPDGSTVQGNNLFAIFNALSETLFHLGNLDSDMSSSELINIFHGHFFAPNKLQTIKASHIPFERSNFDNLHPNRYGTEELLRTDPGKLSPKDREEQQFIRLTIESESIFYAVMEWLYLDLNNKARTGSRKNRLPSERYAEYMNPNKSGLPKPEILQQTTRQERILDKVNSTIFGSFAGASKPEIITTLAQYINVRKARAERMKQVHTDLSFVDTGRKVVGAKLFSTDAKNGLLPLLWAEIMFAVEYNIYARKCTTCKRLFPLVRGKLKQLTCSTACGSKRTVARAKDNPNYREIQRLSMRRTRAKTKTEKDRLTDEINRLRAEGIVKLKERGEINER